MINFDALVLKAGQAAFGEPITIIIDKEEIKTSGILTMTPVIASLEGDTSLQLFKKTLSIRQAGFKNMPVVGNRVLVRGEYYVIENIEKDGQGAACLSLKKGTGENE